MTNPAVALEPESPLLDLLQGELSLEALQELVGVDEPHLPAKLWDRALAEPLREFLRRPGKEFRGRLVTASWYIGGATEPPPLELPLLVELLHAGSLVVDDIQDESTYRRGEPALHCLYGVPVALNAGNWLYFWPFKLVKKLDLPATTQLALHELMTQTLMSCHQGQALDLTVRMGELAQREVLAAVNATTRLKTGALMAFAACLGAVAAGADQERIQTLRHFGMELGVGLQMLDDLGGITSERRCHKGHEDLVHGRPTWPWAWLSEQVDEVTCAHLFALARDVRSRDVHPEVLAERMRSSIGSFGQQRVREHLAQTLSNLRHALRHTADRGLIARLEAELQRLERSYD